MTNEKRLFIIRLKKKIIITMKKKFKRLWISAIGWTLVIGFVNNLIIRPFANIELVEWNGLITALAVLIGISGARDYFLKNALDKIPENRSGKGWQRLWIPMVGWALWGGFFINCALAPYIDLQVSDWTQLISALTVMLGISGARDIGLRRIGKNEAAADLAKAIDEDAKDKKAEKEES